MHAWTSVCFCSHSRWMCKHTYTLFCGGGGGGWWLFNVHSVHSFSFDGPRFVYFFGGKWKYVCVFSLCWRLASLFISASFVFITLYLLVCSGTLINYYCLDLISVTSCSRRYGILILKLLSRLIHFMVIYIWCLWPVASHGFLFFICHWICKSFLLWSSFLFTCHLQWLQVLRQKATSMKQDYTEMSSTVSQ